ncbi:hydroxyacid dehydrogenase [Patescibacteria group bacterium]|nr:hydroxyacid dehydrogenase [Patescibacteria group bacterium]MBU1952022.1 hydroxyacid dehydrogenase [Patescibacteria group bacterium]
MTPKCKKASVAFFEVEKWEKEYLENELKGHDLKFYEGIVDKKSIREIQNIDIISPFIYSRIDKSVLNSLPNLKLVSTRSTGFDHIDIKAATKAKIKVANVPTYGANTVAEHTFALILSLARKIHKSYERTSRGNFSLEGLRGFDLRDKTIGIVGGGHIGQHVARIAKGFNMNVLVFDVRRDLKMAKSMGFKYETLENLIKKSDIITLHAPYNKKTRHLINRKNIKLIKDGAMIINTARGGLIDTTALIDGLRSGKLTGIGLDVLEEEKYLLKEEAELLSPHFISTNEQNLNDYLETIVEGHMLLISDKVIVTPHNAFNSKEALERILDTTIENIKNCCQNKKVINLVN